MVNYIDTTFNALADPTRRQVIERLRRGPHRAGELAAAFEMSPPAMSRHLRVLKKNGLIDEDRSDQDARVRMFRLRKQRFAELRAWVDEVEAFWADQLGAFKDHVERTGGERD